MNTVLWIIWILLIVIGLLWLGSFIGFGLITWCYATDPDFWNRNIQPLLKDLREWVDAGNRIKDYPKERLDKLKGKYDES